MEELKNENTQPEQQAEHNENNQDALPETVQGTTVYSEKILTKKQQNARTALRWILITLGAVMMSSSVYFFQAPNDFTLGGIAGLAILLTSFTPLTQGTWMLIINGFLLVLGLIILGKQCTIRTIYCSALYTGLIYMFEWVIPLNGPLTDQAFLELVYAILLFGIGGAIIFNCGASSGGTDIIALILKKYSKINVGIALFIIDFIVVCIGVFEFTVVTALFSFMGLFAKSFLLDSVVESMSKTKYLTIITTKPEEIGEYILDVIDHSYTMYEGTGGYTGEKKFILITICKRSEALRIKSKVKQIDASSFVIVSNASEIIGKGFGGTI